MNGQDRVYDICTSLLAQTHSIQNLLIYAVHKGDVSDGIVDEIIRHTKHMAEMAERLNK